MRFLDFLLLASRAQRQVEFLIDELLPIGAHDGGIHALDVCPAQEMCITVGTLDRTVRLWAPAHFRCALSTSFPHAPACVSIHPLGFQVRSRSDGFVIECARL